MPLHPQLWDILLRLTLTLLAGFMIGINRSEHGKPAGVRTTMLVSLAASLSMILANLLIDTTGKEPGSFVQLDMMRLPLGILTGMGFIGGGTILRRGSLIAGVTTAATLWFSTMLGFCFGAGQFPLGLTALVLALLILWLVKKFEDRLRQVHRGTLIVTTAIDAPTDDDIRRHLRESHFIINSWAVAYSTSKSQRKIRAIVEWRALPNDCSVPPFVEKLRAAPGLQRLHWTPTGGAK